MFIIQNLHQFPSLKSISVTFFKSHTWKSNNQVAISTLMVVDKARAQRSTRRCSRYSNHLLLYQESNSNSPYNHSLSNSKIQTTTGMASSSLSKVSSSGRTFERPNTSSRKKSSARSSLRSKASAILKNRSTRTSYVESRCSSTP